MLRIIINMLNIWIFYFTCGFSSHICQTHIQVLKNLRCQSRSYHLKLSHDPSRSHRTACRGHDQFGGSKRCLHVKSPNLKTKCIADLRYTSGYCLKLVGSDSRLLCVTNLIVLIVHIKSLLLQKHDASTTKIKDF